MADRPLSPAEVAAQQAANPGFFGTPGGNVAQLFGSLLPFAFPGGVVASGPIGTFFDQLRANELNQESEALNAALLGSAEGTQDQINQASGGFGQAFNTFDQALNGLNFGAGTDILQQGFSQISPINTGQIFPSFFEGLGGITQGALGLIGGGRAGAASVLEGTNQAVHDTLGAINAQDILQGGQLDPTALGNEIIGGLNLPEFSPTAAFERAAAGTQRGTQLARQQLGATATPQQLFAAESAISDQGGRAALQAQANTQQLQQGQQEFIGGLQAQTGTAAQNINAALTQAEAAADLATGQQQAGIQAQLGGQLGNIFSQTGIAQGQTLAALGPQVTAALGQMLDTMQFNRNLIKEMTSELAQTTDAATQNQLQAEIARLTAEMESTTSTLNALGLGEQIVQSAAGLEASPLFIPPSQGVQQAVVNKRSGQVETPSVF